ncbi:DNA-binding MarR family transcriptional regulator [Herbihabitans rhizosphaerae]|uniref:DNA-binding MarR family transcriptional regulator n=1 Tax=Herbihabitans rhizosphaerae TaxID=1872711 RepID=A0A4Q7L4H2_9PSEU|nr:MarR family transcriptional regulator [Herbihabitans rhizosphaerae]RZS43102.1 DNA-binding MarR family transcriptional regulator [Herbihabitans rhizosphaerae]
MAKKEVQLSASTVMQAIRAGRVLQKRLEGELAELGLTMRHLGALGHLNRRPDMSYSELARRSGVTAPSMLATVRGLETMGAVHRTLAGQGHPARLEVTPEGKKLLDKVRVIVGGLDDELTASLTGAQREALDEALLVAASLPERFDDDAW